MISNTSKDGTGTALIPIVDSDGHLQVDALSGAIEVRVVQAADGGLGAYAAGDVISADDCCTTLAIPWLFTGMAKAAGGYGVIVGATLLNETENQAVQYVLKLFNTTPTGEKRDNYPDTNPLAADISKWIGNIAFPSTVAGGATMATFTQASPSTVGNLPLSYKCAAASTTISGVLVTKTAYTQDAGDDIEIALQVVYL